MADIDKVIKGLECCWASFPKCRGCPVCPYEKICYHDKACNELLRDALALLKEQPQWIPISVEKPKCKGDYIVTRWVSVECTKKMLSDIAYFNGTDTWYDDCYTVYDPDRIVAWMSLPEPYRTGI